MTESKEMRELADMVAKMDQEPHPLARFDFTMPDLSDLAGELDWTPDVFPHFTDGERAGRPLGLSGERACPSEAVYGLYKADCDRLGTSLQNGAGKAFTALREGKPNDQAD